MLKNSGKYFTILIAFCLFLTVTPDFQADVSNKVKELEERSKRLYGDSQRRPTKQWELGSEDASLYPNGDVQKLAEISHRWINYYHCTRNMVKCITSTGHLPSVSVVAYEGEVARLPCGLCVAPGEHERVIWFYAESLRNITFTPVNDKNTLIMNANVTIYNVQARHAGLYRCQLGSSIGGPVVLQVLDDDNYNVINVEPHHRAHAAAQTTSISQLITFILWSPWSECSRCDHAGKRRRYGMCYVRINNTELAVTTSSSISIFQDIFLQEFPNGVACRSSLLPAAYQNDPTIRNRKNVIMIESCQISCKQVFEVRSKSGELLEKANNGAGVYSLSQTPPPQPQLPARDVIFTEYGNRLTLKCPGTTLRDIPITWRKGTKYLTVSKHGQDTTDRVILNARDQVVFDSVEDGDTNVYSCWQSTALAGVFKLEVWRDARLTNGRPVAVICLVVVALALHYAVKLLSSKKQRLP